MIRPSLFAAALALSLMTTPAMAKADQDMEAVKHYLITPALMQKIRNAETEMKAIKKEDSDDDYDEDKEPSIARMVKKIEDHPKARAVLSKHNIGARDLVMASFASVHAGMWVATESSMDPKKAAVSYAAMTKEQKANIELFRTLAKAQKK